MKLPMKTLFTTTIVILACALSTGSFAHPNDPVEPTPPPVVLQGFISNNTGFTIQVDSNGCTRKESFDLHLLESFPLQVHVTRKSEDQCRMYLAYGTQITYTYKELGLSSPQSFFILNEINPGLLPHSRN